MLQTRKWMRNSGKRWGLNREAGEKRDEEWEEEMDRDIISKSWEWMYKNKQMEVLVSSLWILIDFLSVWWTICCIIRKLIFHQQHSWKRNERDECHEWWQSTWTWKDCEYFTPHSFTLCTFVPFSWSMSSSSSSSKWFFQELLVTFPSPVSQVIESIYAWTSNKSIDDKMTHFLWTSVWVKCTRIFWHFSSWNRKVMPEALDPEPTSKLNVMTLLSVSVRHQNKQL